MFWGTVYNYWVWTLCNRSNWRLSWKKFFIDLSCLLTLLSRMFYAFRIQLLSFLLKLGTLTDVISLAAPQEAPQPASVNILSSAQRSCEVKFSSGESGPFERCLCFTWHRVSCHGERRWTQSLLWSRLRALTRNTFWADLRRQNAGMVWRWQARNV